MRNTKLVPLAVASSLAILLLLAGWHHETTITPAIVSIGSQIKGMQASSAEIGSEKFTRESLHFEHSGYKKWVYSKHNYHTAATGSILIASALANVHSFGGDRSFRDFYDVLETLEYPKSLMALAFYCGSQEVLETVREYFDQMAKTGSCEYNQVTILYAPFLHAEGSPYQASKSTHMASGRNFIIQNALEGEQFMLFTDPDVVSFDHKDMLQRFVDSEKDIVVPRVASINGLDHDPKSWRGPRAVPSDHQLSLMDEGKWDEAAFTPANMEGEVYNLGSHTQEINELMDSDRKLDLNYAVDLDSVGGAVLFAKSVIYKQGIVFPTLSIVGTSWSRSQGYDGIGTEGLCYMANSLGYKCYGMPNLVAHRSDS